MTRKGSGARSYGWRASSRNSALALRRGCTWSGHGALRPAAEFRGGIDGSLDGAPGRSSGFISKESATAALALIEAADAALASEIRELVIEVVGASRSAHAGRGFGGASSFMLWGSVLLNTEYYDAKLDMMAALLHETAHQLLFGLSLDQPVVENDVEERYASPLRPDPRPDGWNFSRHVCMRSHALRVCALDGVSNGRIGLRGPDTCCAAPAEIPQQIF